VSQFKHGVHDMVGIGASLGGVSALREMLSHIPTGFHGAIFAVVHRSPFHTDHLARVIRGRSEHSVIEPTDGEPVVTGHVYLAPRDLHLVVEHDTIRLARDPKEHFTRPAIDPLFRSLAAYGARAVGIVLSGGGNDGHAGLMAIKRGGGLALVQRPEESAASSMPRNAINKDRVDAVLSLRELSEAVDAMMRGGEWRHARAK
jgi:two-component system chemotaxis response regulator CheB